MLPQTDIHQTDKHHKKAVTDLFSNSTDYWRAVYEKDNDINPFKRYHFTGRKDAVLSLMEEHGGKPPLNVLDIGCGTGVILREVLDRGHYATGMDISGNMLNKAQELTRDYPQERVFFMQNDIEKMPFTKNSFDVVLCVGVLEYLEQDEKGICQISRALKNNGIVILTLPNMFRINNILDPYYYFNRGLKYLFYKMVKSRIKHVKPEEFLTNDTFKDRRYYYRQLFGLFKKYHLKVIKTISLGYGPMTFWRKELFSSSFSIKLSKYLEIKNQRQYPSILRLVPNRWVICLKKTHIASAKDLKQNLSNKREKNIT